MSDAIGYGKTDATIGKVPAQALDEFAERRIAELERRCAELERALANIEPKETTP